MASPTLSCGGARFAVARLATGMTVPSLNSNRARLVSDPRGAPVSLRHAQSIHYFSSATVLRRLSRQRSQHELAADRASEQAAECIAARTATASSSIGPGMTHLDVPSLAVKRPIYGIMRNTSLCRHFSFRTSCLERDGKGPKEQGPETAAGVTSTSAIRKVLPKALGSALTPHENIYTIPNLLTFSRIIASPFIGYAILHDAHAWALGLFVYAGVSDLLDGWIARRWKLQTVVGSIVDPMADKMLMTILTVCLAAKGALPIWLAGIILGRDVGLAISAIYYRWISLPPPKTFTRYWDFSLPSAEVRPTTISKYNTFLQLALMGSTVVAPLVTGIEVGPALIGLQYIVATTTIWSGLSYVFSKDAVKILSDAKSKDNAANEDKSREQ
ncbi:hypothetical protein PFICI_12614 [Pestalotiopsis fici W106-1]|uniref:Uncharacterized protein n=1 Tax=Pestalotiopsis fici (strain W106-1 / CGMCC3.15140) TaxID=1229662 RepID=W3WP39_PESFW|nr:uncharacterized protein PFICI_12614 [Pestalotiopsis fici W106-1]ETS75670.1 hypothetical protein PFICI_12614 [Pestalotiopsis fici W106-1]